MAVYSYGLANGQTRWMYIFDLPAGADGRRRQMKRKAFPSQAAALAAEADSRAAYGGADLSADGTLAAELDSWLSEREIDVQLTTVVNYRDLVRCYITPYIGTRQLYTIDKRAIHDLYTTLLKRGSKTGGPLSPTTVRTVHRVLMKALGDLGITVAGVRQPRQAERETMGRKGVWTPAQSADFLRYHADSRLFAAWALAIVTGMRRGELAGLNLDPWTGSVHYDQEAVWGCDESVL